MNKETVNKEVVYCEDCKNFIPNKQFPDTPSEAKRLACCKAYPKKPDVVFRKPTEYPFCYIVREYKQNNANICSEFEPKE